MYRRTFLKSVGAGAIVGTKVSVSARGQTPAATGGAPATTSPRLFSGCCAYSYRADLIHHRMTMQDFIRKGVELGVDGVDMTVLGSKDAGGTQ